MVSKKSSLLILALFIIAAASACADISLTPTPVDYTPDLGGLIKAANIVDYSNLETFGSSFFKNGADVGIYDDIHRTTSNRITGLKLAIYNANETPASLYVRIFSNTAENNIEDATHIATYGYSGFGYGGGVYSISFDTPIDAPQHLWIGIQTVSDNVGFLMFNPPTTGSSENALAADINGDGILDQIWSFAEPGVANFGIEVVSEETTPEVPEPGSLMALGSGLLGVLAIRRRAR